MRGGYDRVEGSIGRSYNEIKGVTMSMSRNFYKLGKITAESNLLKRNILRYTRLQLKLSNGNGKVRFPWVP